MAMTELDPHRVVDAFFAGTVFLDVILSGLPSAPVPGQEIWAAGRALSPGGIANNAAGTARLGLRTGLAAAFGDDACGDLAWRMLAAEPRLDLSWSRRVPGLDTALTVSLSTATAADRALVSHGALNPVPLDDLTKTVPRAGATFVSLSTGARLPSWIASQRAAGAIVFADVGWDERYGWSRDALDQLTGIDVFVPNDVEAMAYTGASTPRAALRALGELVPQVVITCGARGGRGGPAVLPPPPRGRGAGVGRRNRRRGGRTGDSRHPRHRHHWRRRRVRRRADPRDPGRPATGQPGSLRLRLRRAGGSQARRRSRRARPVRHRDLARGCATRVRIHP
jgi:sugar/nucleoside kinase (ribokinase family)